MQSGNGLDNLPSLIDDPALTGTLLGAFNVAIDKIIQGLNNRLPASVLAYDRTTNRANVQILIPMVTTQGAVIPRSQVASVPVQIDGGGGFFISFPLKNGDLGWIEACDRDISLFLQTYQQTKPNTFRKWSFSDGKFTPSVMKGITIDTSDSNSLVISTLDGSVKIAVSEDGITLTAPTVLVKGNLSVTGEIRGGSDLAYGKLSGGNFEVTGFITAGGDITPFTPPT